MHVGFLVFLFTGGMLYRAFEGAAADWVLATHLAALAYSIIISLFSLPCPLTALQKWFDRRAGRAPYEGDCVAHYLWSKLPVEGNEAWLLVSLLFIALAINAPFYLYVR